MSTTSTSTSTSTSTMNSSAADDESKPQVLLRRKVFDGKSWSAWEDLYHRPPPQETPVPFVYNFSVNTQIVKRNGRKKQEKIPAGQLCIFPNLLKVAEQQQITNELRQKASYFRQYRVQNQDEPRTHFLLHSQATENCDERQPGYRYGSVRMMARPLQHFPEIQSLAESLEEQARANNMDGAADIEEGEPFWNIGVNPVLYRDGRDRIGFHADDDQKEQLIWTALVASPSSTTRSVQLRRKLKRKQKRKDLQQDELFELFLDAGDSYSMDGLMQQYYIHSVPCDKKSVATTNVPKQQQDEGHSSPQDQEQQQQEQQRIAIVFRRGDQTMQGRDSGRPFASLIPRPPISYTFGNHLALDANTTTLSNDDSLTLTEADTYTRNQLWEMGAHHSLQKGVSGNQKIGCDAIIVSGKRPDGLGCDQLGRLVYAANGREGARAFLTNCNTNDNSKPIRIFRSSVLQSEYRALVMGNNSTAASSKAARYRYDGLYRVDDVHYTTASPADNRVLYHVEDPSKHATLKSLPSGRIYLFTLVRCDHHDSIQDGDIAIDAADDATESEQLQQHLHNVMATDELVRQAIQQGSLSNETRHSLKTRKQQSEWKTLFSNVHPECKDEFAKDEVPKKKAVKVPKKKSVSATAAARKKKPPPTSTSSKTLAAASRRSKMPSKHKRSKKAPPPPPTSTTPSSSASLPPQPLRLRNDDNLFGAEQLTHLSSDLLSISTLHNLKRGSWLRHQNPPIAAFGKTMVPTFLDSKHDPSAEASALDGDQPLGMSYLEAMERERVGTVVRSHRSLQQLRRPTLLDHRPPQNVTLPAVEQRVMLPQQQQLAAATEQQLSRRRSSRLNPPPPMCGEGGKSVLEVIPGNSQEKALGKRTRPAEELLPPLKLRRSVRLQQNETAVEPSLSTSA